MVFPKGQYERIIEKTGYNSRERISKLEKLFRPAEEGDEFIERIANSRYKIEEIKSGRIEHDLANQYRDGDIKREDIRLMHNGRMHKIGDLSLNDSVAMLVEANNGHIYSLDKNQQEELINTISDEIKKETIDDLMVR